MRKIVVGMLIMLCLAGSAWAIPYTGSISYDYGLVGTTPWAPGTGDKNGATLSWEVEFNDASELWTYDYTFDVTNSDKVKEISHLIIEVSDSFIDNNIYDGTTTTADEWVASRGLDSFGDDGNPGIPGDIYGIKWDTTGDPDKLAWTIVTDRMPMWGDFYAKDGTYDGHKIYAYNTGFGVVAGAFEYEVIEEEYIWVDTAIGNGNAFDSDTGFAWVLVPDTISGGGGGDDNPIPEPSTIFLLGGGLLMLAAGWRRKKRK